MPFRLCNLAGLFVGFAPSIRLSEFELSPPEWLVDSRRYTGIFAGILRNGRRLAADIRPFDSDYSGYSTQSTVIGAKTSKNQEPIRINRLGYGFLVKIGIWEISET